MILFAAQLLKRMAAAVVAVINTSFSEDRDLDSFVGKQLCRLAFQVLRLLANHAIFVNVKPFALSFDSTIVSEEFFGWGPEWLWGQSLQWLTLMASDRECIVRECALSVLASMLQNRDAALLIHVSIYLHVIIVQIFVYKL